MTDERAKETLEAARKLLENLIHYRSGYSHYETDLTTAMRVIRHFYEEGLQERGYVPTKE